VSVITEKGDITTSYLLIQNADLADSGRYSCSPSNADVASVRVHVLNGNLDFFFSSPQKWKNLSRLYRITRAKHVRVPSDKFCRDKCEGNLFLRFPLPLLPINPSCWQEQIILTSSSKQDVHNLVIIISVTISSRFNFR
jgi:hypothetical protein